MAKQAKRQPELVNQTNAARIVGVARQSIAGMIARGELESEAIAGLVFVRRASAERLAKIRAKEAAAA